MMRSLGTVAHGIIDYAMVVILVIGPSVAGFVGRQARWSYIFAAILFVTSLLTRYPLGVIKVVRLPVHAAIELLIALMLLVMPWVGSFAAGVNSRNFYVAIAVLMLLLWLLSDFRSAPRDA